MDNKRLSGSWADEVDDELGDPTGRTFYDPTENIQPLTPIDQDKDNGYGREREREVDGAKDEEVGDGKKEIDVGGPEEANLPENFEVRSHFSDSSSDEESTDKQNGQPEDDSDEGEIQRDSSERVPVVSTGAEQVGEHDLRLLSPGSLPMHGPGTLKGALLPFEIDRDDNRVHHDIYWFNRLVPPNSPRRGWERRRPPYPKKTSALAASASPKAALNRAEDTIVDLRQDREKAWGECKQLQAQIKSAWDETQRTRAEMTDAGNKFFEAMKQVKKKEVELTNRTTERDSFKKAFLNAKPLIIESKERRRRMQEDNRDAGTQTEPAQTSSLGTQTDPPPAEASHAGTQNDPVQEDPLQSLSVSSSQELCVQLAKRILEWLNRRRRRSRVMGNNLLPSLARLVDLLSEPDMTVAQLVSALEEEGLKVDGAELDRIIRARLGIEDTASPHTTDNGRCTNCPKLLATILILGSERKELQTDNDKMKSAVRELTKRYHDLEATNEVVLAELGKYTEEPSPDKPSTSQLALLDGLRKHGKVLAYQIERRDALLEEWEKVIDRLQRTKSSQEQKIKWHEARYQKLFDKYSSLQRWIQSDEFQDVITANPLPEPCTPPHPGRRTSAATVIEEEVVLESASNAQAPMQAPRTLTVNIEVEGVASFIWRFVLFLLFLFLFFEILPRPLHLLWHYLESLA